MTDEQRRRQAVSPKTLRAAVLLAGGRRWLCPHSPSGDAPTSPPGPPAQSLAAGPLPVSVQALGSNFYLPERSKTVALVGGDRPLSAEDPVIRFFSGRWNVWGGVLVALLWAASSHAAESKARAALLILKNECFSCHGELKQKGGLALNTRDALLKGSEEGPVVQEGKPQESRLIQLLQVGADPHMPPRKQLEPQQIRILQEWVRGGMPWDSSVLTDEDAVQPVALNPLPETFHPSWALAFSPDGHRLAVGTGGTVALYDLTTPSFSRLAQVMAHEDGVQSLAWSKDGQTLASGGFRKIHLWKGDSLQHAREITVGLSGRVTALEFAPIDSQLALADGGNGKPGYIRLISTRDGTVQRSWRAHNDTVFDLEFSRDGTRLLTAGGDTLVKVWDLPNGRVAAVLEGHLAQVLSAAFNTKATQIVSGGADRQLKVWDIATREKIISLGNHSSAVTAVAWPGDGSSVFATTDRGLVYRYTQLKSHTGEQSSASGDERQLADVGDSAWCLGVASDGKRLAVGDQNGRVRIWDTEGKVLGEIPLPKPESPAAREPSPAAAAVAFPTIQPAKATSPKPAIPPPALWKTSDIVSISAEPSELRLSAGDAGHGLVFTARLVDGFEVDVTDRVRLRAGKGAVRIGESGAIEAIHAGRAVVTAQIGKHTVSVPVEVQSHGADTSSAPSFVRDVLPRLNQAGCSSGGCHSKPEGQSGFKLTVFSYDPVSDYAEIVKDARGRRVFPSAPEESLLLTKPLTLVPHEGGQRFRSGSDTHRLLVRWIQAGMPYSLTNEPALQKVTVFPQERRYRKAGTQRLLVLAHYTDGSVRDVTRMAAYDSNDKEMVKVDEIGRLKVGQLTGQGVVVARYMGFVAGSQVIVPAEKVYPAENYASIPSYNFIDSLSVAQFQRLGLMPSELCSDAEFIRRSKLDAVGLLPTPEEVRAFMADAAPDKRQRWIVRILNDPAYADYWANKWADLLRPNPDRVGIKSVFLLDQWLREQFQANRPYDQFVRDILLAEGSNHRAGPAVVYRDRREPAELTTQFSQLFLGTRLECAKCHHHPNEKWSQDDFYQLAAYFGPVKQKGAGLSPPISAGTETFYFAPGGVVKHPVSGSVMVPRPPEGDEYRPGEGDPRKHLADWMTSPRNPFFARAAVNRVWANFFGRGMVHPVDDFRSSNPCVNPALLDALAADFVAHGYDFKHLMKTILESRTYQLSSTPNDSNLADTRHFSRAYRRRLPAEVLMDAVCDVTGVQDSMAAMPSGGRAMQTWSYKIQSHFLDAFGRPNASSDCPCERDTQLSVVQSLHLMNSKALQAKLTDPSGKIRQLVGGSRPETELISELYLLTLSRRPTAAEEQSALRAFQQPGATRQTTMEDLMWALLNSPEFVFNH